MSEEHSDVSSNEDAKRGRPAIATPQAVKDAIEAIHNKGGVIGVRTVRREIGGGAFKTISELLKGMPGVKPIIKAAPDVPEALAKAWKTGVADHTKAAREECQQKLEMAAEVVERQHAEMIDLEASVIELEELLEATRSERDVALGERRAERQAHEQTRSTAESNLARAAKAESTLAEAQQRLEDMSQRAQIAEVRAEVAERGLEESQNRAIRTREENVRLKGQVDGLMHGRQPAAPPATSQSSGAGLPLLSGDQFDDDDVPF